MTRTQKLYSSHPLAQPSTFFPQPYSVRHRTPKSLDFNFRESPWTTIIKTIKDDQPKPLNETISRCLDMLKARAPYDVYGKDRIIKSLTTMGESVGLHSYHDTSMESGVDVVMLSASIVVIDVEIDSEGSVRRAKVQFASGAPPDPRVDRLLTSHLRGNDIIAFQNDINYLAKLDTLTTKFGSKIDFFYTLKTLEQDVLNISKMESEHSSLMDVLKFGHGIPLVNRNRIGLSLAFYGKQESILGMEWESINLDSEDIPEALISDIFYRAHVSIQESNTPGLFLTLDQKTFLKSQNSDFMITDDSFDSIQTESPLLPTRLQYTGPLKPSSDVHVGYVLELDPPVVLPLAAAKEISKKIGLENGFQDGNELMEYPDFVLRTVTEFPESFNVESVVSGASFLQKELPEFGITLNAKLTAESTSPATLISHIPFTHPSQIYEIITVLRRHLRFLDLWKSIFAGSVPLYSQNRGLGTSSKRKLGTDVVSMSVCLREGPEEIEFDVDGKSLKVRMKEDGEFVVQTGSPRIEDDEGKLSRVANMSGDGGVLLGWWIQSHRLGSSDANNDAGNDTGNDSGSGMSKKIK